MPEGDGANLRGALGIDELRVQYKEGGYSASVTFAVKGGARDVSSGHWRTSLDEAVEVVLAEVSRYRQAERAGANGT